MGNGLTLELSEKYEKMDKCFKDKVKKTHAKIVHLIEIYEMMKNNPVAKQGDDRLMARILFGDENHFDKIRCEACFMRFSYKRQLQAHIWKYHDSSNLGKISPYPELDCCPLGCHSPGSDLLSHFVLMHSYHELESISMNRNYLNLLLGHWDLKQFCKG